MLSRAVCVPRICLTCRLGLVQRRVRLGPYRGDLGPRRYASDSSVQSKQRIEALITGTTYHDPTAKSKPRKRGRGSRGRRDEIEEEAPWEKEEDQPQRQSGKGTQVDDAPDNDAAESTAPTPIFVYPWESESKTAQKWGNRVEQAQREAEGEDAAPEALEVKEKDELDENDLLWEDKDLLSEPQPDEDAKDVLADEALLNADELPRELSNDLSEGHLLRNQYLAVDALGSPMEALIIKNPNQMRRIRRRGQIVKAMASSDDKMDWDALLQMSEEADMGLMEEAMVNIEEQRPRESKVIRRRDMEALEAMLVEGFTRDQLAHFLGQNRRQEKREGNIQAPWLIKQGPWEGTYSDGRGTLKPKQQQAILIMNEIWGLQIKEQTGDVGRTPVWVRPDVFRIIARPSNPILENLKVNLLDESADERIAPSSTESRLDIYSRRSIAPVLLGQLDNILNTITTRKVAVQHVVSENLSPSVLEDLGRITNTSIKHDRAAAELEISWLTKGASFLPAESNGDLPTPRVESPADIISRLLIVGPSQAVESEAKVLVPSKTPKATKGTFLAYHREKRNMSWRDKLRQWARYVHPISKAAKTKEKSLHLADHVSLPEPPFETAGRGPANRIAATFGHLLHTKHDIDATKLASSRRIISPVIPHPASLTALAIDETQEVSQRTAIVINFVPDPAKGASVPDNAPEVRFRLPIDSDTVMSSFAIPAESTLNGVVPWHVADMLLPGESVDVRLVQQKLIPLDINQQSLRDFLAGSEFNLLAGHLRTPSHTTFSIPSRWLDSNTTSEQAIDVPYMFTGLEIHQTVDMEWHNNTLRYNSVEAGQHGGQRQELSLVAGPPSSDKSTVVDESQRARFLQLVEEVALGKHFSWGEGYVLMKERAEPDFAVEMEPEEDDAPVGVEQDGILPAGEDMTLREHASEDKDAADGEDALPFELRLSEEDTITPDLDESVLGTAAEDPSLPKTSRSADSSIDDSSAVDHRKEPDQK